AADLDAEKRGPHRLLHPPIDKGARWRVAFGSMRTVQSTRLPVAREGAQEPLHVRQGIRNEVRVELVDLVELKGRLLEGGGRLPDRLGLFLRKPRQDIAQGRRRLRA